MKGMESGSEKVRKISEALRKETLEPAILEAEEIIAQAREEAQRILAHAKKESLIILEAGKDKLEQEKTTFQAALNQASKQTVLFLRQMR